MTEIQKNSVIAATIALIVLTADQALKLWVHSSFYLNEEFVITDWFRLHYIENDGIAFGITLFDKRILTIFRIIVSGLIVWYIVHCIKHNASTLFIVCLSLIFAGATGNIIDCVFYGIMFDYAPLFYGRVIDMLYFPLIEWDVSGSHYIFFSPIFNLADSAITIGVFMILIFNKVIFKE